MAVPLDSHLPFTALDNAGCLSALKIKNYTTFSTPGPQPRYRHPTGAIALLQYHLEAHAGRTRASAPTASVALPGATVA
jgi:hypothetical protein